MIVSFSFWILPKEPCVVCELQFADPWVRQSPFIGYCHGVISQQWQSAHCWLATSLVLHPSVMTFMKQLEPEGICSGCPSARWIGSWGYLPGFRSRPITRCNVTVNRICINRTNSNNDNKTSCLESINMSQSLTILTRSKGNPDFSHARVVTGGEE